MTGSADWLSYDEALEAVLAACEPLDPQAAPAAEGLGLALAEPVVSRLAHPPWDDSAMDGFAVRAGDVEGASPERPVTLPISDDVPAGAFPAGPLRPGTAARVMTGAPVPEGATGVIRVEHTDGGRDGRVAVRRASDARRNIRRAGEDVRPGDVVLRAGDTLDPAAVGIVALAGRREVSVVRRPRVGVLSGGDELAGPEELEEAVAGRRIPDTNGPALLAGVRAAGAEPAWLGLARDDPDDLRRRLAGAPACDALVSSAGVSVGERDHVKRVLDELGFERAFWRVKVRPGSALLFGRLEGRPFWGVPGNPVSAVVAFEAFVRPGLRRLGGHARCRRRPLPAEAGERMKSPRGVTSLYRVRLVAEPEDPAARPRAFLTGPQGSGILTSLAGADGLAVVPEGTEVVEAGETIPVLPLSPWTDTG